MHPDANVVLVREDQQFEHQEEPLERRGVGIIRTVITGLMTEMVFLRKAKPASMIHCCFT